MSQILKRGQTVRTKSSSLSCEVEQFLGGGGQGEVYKATWADKLVALKWYFPQAATPEQKASIERLVKMGPPNERFLWPIELVSSPQVLGFGYLMPLREPRYKSLVDLMKRRIEPSFRALATAGLKLADSFLALHSRGLCYRDISFGNVFFDPDSGSVLICDNDNVTVDGAGKGGVLGTPRFMAPEIVREEAAPSTQTDLFSLAVLLFYLFIVHHPLEGKKEASIRCLDLPAMTKLYGTEPIFIFDPHNRCNEPIRGYHDNALDFWPLYPSFLKDLFTRAFTEGLRDPLNGRVRESEWRAAMIRLRDAICYCPHCGSENFYDEATAAAGSEPSCWQCKQALRLPLRLCLGKAQVMLNHDTRLYPHHTDANKPYDFSHPSAQVSQHPANPGVWGLKNLTQENWSIKGTDGLVKDVPPGRSVSLMPGLTIHFGTLEGTIER
ncbi:MAG TPA: hypothetical protein VFB38_00730 [Chthonomonadaceae bacterium]|nr:hypothetical protein [Chthonomonadaceae bacterium]